MLVGELDVGARVVVIVCAFLFLSSTWARNMSTAGSMWSTKRRPPGSFAHCCSVMPIWIAVHRSTVGLVGHPADLTGRRPCPGTTATPDAIDASDGVKPGIVRWNSSW